MNVSFATAAGSPDKPNEDWVGATTDTVVVLDGITTPDGLDTGCIHGTPWYVQQLGLALLARASTDHDRELRQHLRDAINGVAELHRTECDLQHLGTPGATVAMLRERNNQVDWLVLSDSFVVLDTISGIEVHTDDRLDQVAVEEKATMRSEIIGTPQHDAARRAVVTAQRAVRNADHGYWIAGSNPSAADHVLAGSLGRTEFRRAAVLTDGAAVIAEHLVMPWADVLELLAETGPLVLLNAVRTHEASDPQGRAYARFKTSDDATAAYYQTRQ